MVMTDHECSVCMRPVDAAAPLGAPDSGGYVPVQFPNEPPVEVWLHHRCLSNDRKRDVPVDGRTLLDRAEHPAEPHVGAVRPEA
jgi:hypothetical protein